MKEYRQTSNYRKTSNDYYRKVSLSTILKIWFSNTFNIIGLPFLLIGLLFAYIFLPVQDIFNEKITEDDIVAEGKITEVQYANASVGDVDVYKFTYTYSTPEGDFTGEAYATGEIFDKGDDVIVYYKQRNPELSMVPELRKSIFGGSGFWFLAIFPLIGLLMLFFGTKNLPKIIRVLKIGQLAKGKLIKTEITNVTVNDSPVCILTFEFTAQDGKRYECVAKTHKTYELEDEEEEQLLYDPDNPEQAVLLDTLPKSVKKYLLKQSL